jgi:hypothetical protein
MAATERIPVKEKIGYSLGMRQAILYLIRQSPSWPITTPIYMACHLR